MYRVILAAVLLCFSYSSFAAPKPKEVTATDVQCTDCVDQQDMADGAVGENELTQALLDRINELEAKPDPIQVLANGESVGTFMQQGLGGFGALSSTGFTFTIVPAGSQEATLTIVNLYRYFESSDCTGTILLPIGSDGFLSGFLGVGNQGIVYGLWDETTEQAYAHYSRASFPLPQRQIRSRFVGGVQCEIFDEPRLQGDLIPSMPNDPAITGVPNEPFTAPITLGQ